MQDMGVWDCGSLLTQNFAKESPSVCEEKMEQYGNSASLVGGMNGVEKVSSWIRGSLIGAGAFGKVNLALNRENGELFAVKSIECNERTGSEMAAIENEVSILQSLDSPYVVKCLGASFSMEDGKQMRNVFIEHMSGGSVADLMKKFGGHFDEPLIRNYTRGILEGLQYLHSRDIVHCDIKGKNVLVGSSGVKLADFGGAKRVSDMQMDEQKQQQSQSQDDMESLLNVKGTPLWMAPEVVRQIEQGPASDIWSLGCTVVEMATGKAPWSDIATGGNPFVALYHIGCTEEVPILPSCLSEEAQDFLSKCFQRDPRVRWTAQQLLQHPFITENFPVMNDSSNFPSPSSPSSPSPRSFKPAPLQHAQQQPESTSPTSVLDFPSHSDAIGTYTSSIANSVPILRSPLFVAKRDPAPQQQQIVNFQTEEPCAPAKEKESAGTDFWCNSPLSPMPGQWIVVRSPKATSPSSPPPPCPVSWELPAAAAPTIPGSTEETDGEEGRVSADCKSLLPAIAVQKVAVVCLPERDVPSSCVETIEVDDEEEVDMEMAGDEDDDVLIFRMEYDVDEQIANHKKAETSNRADCSFEDWNRILHEEALYTSAPMTLQCRDSMAEKAGMASGSRRARLLSYRAKKLLSDSTKCCLLADTRCIDTHGKRRQPQKFASLRATLRKLGSTHTDRKMAVRARPKPLPRLAVRKELHELVFEKVMTLGRSLCSFSLRAQIQARIRRVPATILGHLTDSRHDLFFRARPFMANKIVAPWGCLLYKFSIVGVQLILIHSKLVGCLSVSRDWIV